MDYRNFCDSLTPDDIYERELFTSVQALILSVKVLPLAHLNKARFKSKSYFLSWLFRKNC